MPGLRRLGHTLETSEPARFARLYYEEILGRSPETAARAQRLIENPSDCILDFLCSDEFMSIHDIILQRLFPELVREIYLHVPKTGGTTVFEGFAADPRFCPLLVFPGDQNGWFDDRVLYLRTAIQRITDPRARYLFTFGRGPADRIINNCLKRGWDNVFTTLRDPIDTGISWINYVLTHLINNPTRSDVQEWKRILEVPEDRVFRVPADTFDLITRIVERIIPVNAFCSALGRDVNLETALETAAILDLKLVRLEQIETYMLARGISAQMGLNASGAHISLADLDRSTRLSLYERNSEDLKFYNWVNRHGIAGEGPWIKL